MLLGNGDGTFQEAIDYGAGYSPASVAIADLNGDGKPDVAVAVAGYVSVLIGNGDGTFQEAVKYAAGTRPHSVAIADLNGDTYPDIATAGNAMVLLGNGDGTFQAAVPYGDGTGAVTLSVAIADLNGDGKPDIATANYGQGPSDGNVSVLLGNGDGTFQRAVNYKAGLHPWSIALADLNGDNKPDMVIGGTAWDASVLLGNGDGTFQAPLPYGVGNEQLSVAVADLNGDRKPDIVTANSDSDNVCVLLNNTRYEPKNIIIPFLPILLLDQ